MRKNQKGFLFFELSLVLFILIVVTVIGVSILQKNHDQGNQPSNSINPPITSSAVKYQGSPVAIPLLSQDNPTAKVHFIIPDGWVADKSSQEGLDFFADDLTYNPGTKFTYSSTASSKDIERFMLSTTDRDSLPKIYKIYQKSYLTVNGNNATLYYHEFSAGENIGNVHMLGGEKEYMYFIVRGSDAVMVSYYLLAGDKDQKTLINQVISSITF